MSTDYIEYSDKLQAIVASRTGIAPVHLLDVCDANGNLYYWASRKITVPAVVDAASIAGEVATATPTYLPWILAVPQWKTYRSQQTDMGQIQLQYVSGNTLYRDFDAIMRSSAMEGAFFVYRYWSASAEEALREIHGTLSVEDPTSSTINLTCKQLDNSSSLITPQFMLGETCPLIFGGKRCGSTAAVECQHSFPTCTSPSRIMVIANSYEKNYGEAIVNVSSKSVNRARQF